MSFPQTRPTLIERIAQGGDENAWREFLTDYWAPVCCFALRHGQLSTEDAEDAASLTFLAVLQNRLLARWLTHRSAKLRTLLCCVVRNVLANRARVQQGRARLLREHGGRLDDRDALPLLTSLDAPQEHLDAFETAWVESLVQQAVERLVTEYHRESKGDNFRVLYGRLCEGLSLAETAAALRLTTAQAENAYKDARRRLASRFEELVRDHVLRYCPEEESEDEFAAEWQRLAEHLREHGGLESAVRRSYESAAFSQQTAASSFTAMLKLLAQGPH